MGRGDHATRGHVRTHRAPFALPAHADNHTHLREPSALPMCPRRNAGRPDLTATSKQLHREFSGVRDTLPVKQSVRRSLATNVPTILVDDDEPAIVDCVATALSYEGFHTREATSGVTALASIAEHAPAPIVLDWMLPDLDGIELTRYLRANASQVPILFLSAKGAIEDKVEASGSTRATAVPTWLHLHGITPPQARRHGTAADHPRRLRGLPNDRHTLAARPTSTEDCRDPTTCSSSPLMLNRPPRGDVAATTPSSGARRTAERI